MKVLTCTGFYGTGSGAVTDFFSDCQNVECKGNYEIRILHDPYGISDLEYNLVENPNRHNTSNAIKKFKWIVDFLTSKWGNGKYERYFNGNFKKLSYAYIDEISEFSYYGKWHWDPIERGFLFWFADRAYNKIFYVSKKLLHIHDEEVGHTLLPKNEMSYAGICDEKNFLAATRRYTSGLLNSISKQNEEYIFVDQLVPPSNFVRYSRYVNDLKIIVVDRDPRDIFLLEKYLWKGTVVPYYDVEMFCKWFKWTRKIFENSEITDNVLYIQFEDLIYRYDQSAKKLLEFAGIDKREYRMNCFNPEISIKNTKLWEKYPDSVKEIKYIEKQLPEYCYKYESIL